MNEILVKMIHPVTAHCCQEPMLGKAAGPIHHLRVRRTRESLTIADFDREEDTITLVFRKSGSALSSWAKLEVGDSILNLWGPWESCRSLPTSGNCCRRRRSWRGSILPMRNPQTGVMS